jgi:hypothetical protein
VTVPGNKSMSHRTVTFPDGVPPPCVSRTRLHSLGPIAAPDEYRLAATL